MLIFLAGLSVAGLVALLLIPAVSNRAVRLYRRSVEARLPRTLSEMSAACDAVRAEMAAKTARIEFELTRKTDELVAARCEIAEMQAGVDAVAAERGGMESSVKELEARLAESYEALRVAKEDLARSQARQRDLERRLGSRDDRVAAVAAEAREQDGDGRHALDDADARIAALAETVNDMSQRPIDDDPLRSVAVDDASPSHPVLTIPGDASEEMTGKPPEADGGFSSAGIAEARIETLVTRFRRLRQRSGTHPASASPDSGRIGPADDRRFDADPPDVAPSENVPLQGEALEGGSSGGVPSEPVASDPGQDDPDRSAPGGERTDA